MSPTPWCKNTPRGPSFRELRELTLYVNDGKPEELKADAEYCTDAFISVFDHYVPDHLSAYRGRVMVVIWPNEAANVEVFGWVEDKLTLLEPTTLTIKPKLN